MMFDVGRMFDIECVKISCSAACHWEVQHSGQNQHTCKLFRQEMIDISLDPDRDTDTGGIVLVTSNTDFPLDPDTLTFHSPGAR